LDPASHGEKNRRKAALGSLTLNGVSLPLQMESLAEVVAGAIAQDVADEKW